MKQSEDDLQRACMKWFKFQYRDFAKRISHCPNGGKRSATEGAKFKAMGVLAGYPDIFLSIPRGNYGGAYFELKTGNNSLTENQEEFLKAHEKDYYCAICYSLDEFITAINNYLN